MQIQTEINSAEHNPVLADHLLFAWASMIAAGAVIVVWKSGAYFLSGGFMFDYSGWFFLISFLDIAATASLLVYIRAKESALIQAILTFLSTPVFIIGFMLVTVFLSEMFYGGSGYHGEYMFPFFRRTQL